MKSVHQQPRTQFYRSIAGAFVVLSLSIVGIIFIISFSWATIVISPNVEYIKSTARFNIAENPSNEQGVINGRIIDFDLSATGTFTPSSSESVSQKAAGEIVVINNTTRNQPLVATTRFLASSGRLFRSTQSVVVGHGGSTRVPVIADESGDVGDLTNEQFRIPGLWPGLQESIYGSGFILSESGVKDVRIITEEDTAQAQKALMSKLEEQLAFRIESEGMTESFRPTKNRSINSLTILSKKASHTLGEQTDSFDVSMTAHAEVILFDEAQAREYLMSVLNKQLPQGRELMPLDMSTLTVNLVSSDRDADKAVLSVEGTIGMTLAEHYMALEKKKLTGKTPSEVQSYYQRAVGVDDIEVRLYPFWVTRMPLLYDHISLIIKR